MITTVAGEITGAAGGGAVEGVVGNVGLVDADGLRDARQHPANVHELGMLSNQGFKVSQNPLEVNACPLEIGLTAEGPIRMKRHPRVQDGLIAGRAGEPEHEGDGTFKKEGEVINRERKQAGPPKKLK